MEWISVNESLPELGRRILALAEYICEDSIDYSVCDTELIKSKWKDEDSDEEEIYFTFDGYKHEPITHWMYFELPSTPKE